MGTESPVTATDLSLVQSHNSPVLAADPTDARFVVMAHRLDAPRFSCGLAVSGDGGRSWVPANPVPQLPEGVESCYAPEVAFDRDGLLYLLYVGLAGAGNNPTGAYLVTSADRARTFSTPRQVLGPRSYQVRMALEPERGRHGRLHVVWLAAASDAALGGLTPDPNPIVAMHSDDGGVTFSAPVVLSDPARARAVAPALALGPGGALHVAYYDLQDDARDYQGLEGPPWDGTWSVVVTSSPDGGTTWGGGAAVTESVRPPGRVMLIYTMAPPSLVAGPGGLLYVAWPDARAGDPDAYLARSTDAGRAWSVPVRMNDDRTRATQELPRLALSPSGRLDAVWLDRRNDADDLGTDVYYAWVEEDDRGPVPRVAGNVRLTGQPGDSRVGQRYLVPSAAGLFEIGSRLGLLSRQATVVAAWPDTRNAAVGTTQQDLFTVTVSWPGADGAGAGDGPWAGLLGAAVLLALASAVALVAAGRRQR